MGVNSLPKTATRQRRDCDLNPGPSAPESSTLTTRLPSQMEVKVETEANQRPTDCSAHSCVAFYDVTPTHEMKFPRAEGLRTAPEHSGVGP